MPKMEQWFPDLSRRSFLDLSAKMVITAAVARFATGCSGEEIHRRFETRAYIDPTTKQTMRSFAGSAAPPRQAKITGGSQLVQFDSYFPNENDPFEIKRDLQLGEGGYNLKVLDRGLAGEIPDAASLWPLNMVPFGVAFNGAILDPSGPWYDGGSADPQNPFDRSCSGWEYEVTHPTVMKLVGVPDILQGHVQPSGMFHYHGYSATLIDPLREQDGNTVGLQWVGYSADGFPIIDCNLISKNGRRIRLESGWRLRAGARSAQTRTNPTLTPRGDHDGLYVQDYEFAPKQQRQEGELTIVPLDRRNGIVLGDDFPSLAGFPARHYAYVMTPEWPMIPRFFAHRPDQSFADIVPLTRGGRAGRAQFYEACGVQADAIRGLDGRERY